MYNNNFFPFFFFFTRIQHFKMKSSMITILIIKFCNKNRL